MSSLELRSRARSWDLWSRQQRTFVQSEWQEAVPGQEWARGWAGGSAGQPIKRQKPIPLLLCPHRWWVCEQMGAEAHQVPAVSTSAALASGSTRNGVPQPISQGEG